MNDCILENPLRAAEGYIELRCDCGILLGAAHNRLEGTMLLICPECKATNHWQSAVSYGSVMEEVTDDR